MTTDTRETYTGRDWLEHAVSRLENEIEALPYGLQDEDYPSLDAAIDVLNGLLIRQGNIADALTLARHIADYANGITEERLAELWSENSDTEIADVVDKLAHVVDWLGLS